MSSQYSFNVIKLKRFEAKDFERLIDNNPLAAAYLPLTDYPKEDRLLIKAKAIKGVHKHC